ncbi:unnamed protein product [Rotaria socialis]|uniref:Uncharacterized protein n=1 Tax=Rotaria socialis TaxID=392032 RepID=A0A820SNJ0_9BILA|nr:unnamed protein product [Rotaria socialis]CAF4453867.1 unnamed protein product [Rotaria socialis]CAF4566890.1 unnamed protein product [Rotaria socialis]CAF4810284.1 unnamed protein product [Rotaria socialis]
MLLDGNGKGCRDTFKSLARTSISYDSRPKSVIIVDLNNDIQPDFVVANSGTDNIRVFYRYPIGTFDNQKIYAVATACQAYAVVADALKKDILDNFNNTLTSVRSVSSISSTTSRSLNYDELPRVDQPSSFDILKICYALLIRTLDLLHRLTLND